MLKYLNLFFLLLFLMGICSMSCQRPLRKEVATTLNSNPPNKTDQFPEDWVGLWKGELNIYKPNGDTQTIPMELDIAAIDSSKNFIWALIYGEDKVAGRRSYELEIIDPLKGHYAIDEKNTIKLDCYFFQNKLFSRFQVIDSWLLATYEKEGEKLLFEIISGGNQAVSITGNQKHNGEDIPEVKAYPIIVSQRAILRRS